MGIMHTSNYMSPPNVNAVSNWLGSEKQFCVEMSFFFMVGFLFCGGAVHNLDLIAVIFFATVISALLLKTDCLFCRFFLFIEIV